ncbi:MAG: hypothetical protein KDA37_14140 [Planctomycetales bacterium]|nr:hypothetical protein [Planctomycetales bacterium]
MSTQRTTPPGRATLLPALLTLLLGSVPAATSSAEPVVIRPYSELNVADAEFLDTLAQRTFRFFWETTPENGLVLDRYPSNSPSSIAAIGFGLTAYGVGVERDWVSREAGARRVLATLKTLAGASQSDAPHAAGYQGFFYHFLELDSASRWRECELSSIDTALLMAGVLFCQEFFDRDTDQESEIRRLADHLYRRVQWDWIQPRAPLIAMSWRPEKGFGGADYKGYNEAMLLYVLALGSPTHPVDASAWSAFTETYIWDAFYGPEHVNFSPLFGHQYSHAWIDFRGIQDDYMRSRKSDYFENSRRATYSQRSYAIANPRKWVGYGEDLWGLTACDGPANGVFTFAGQERRFDTYSARGASAEYIRDDGAIAPTAAGGSIAFAPEICVPALQAMRSRYGDDLFGRYGFLDSFNPSFTFADAPIKRGKIVPGKGWINGDYLGIDQGPIVLMIENYRSGLVWRVMRRNEHIRRGLGRAGFEGGWLDAASNSP